MKCVQLRNMRSFEQCTIVNDVQLCNMCNCEKCTVVNSVQLEAVYMYVHHAVVGTAVKNIWL